MGFELKPLPLQAQFAPVYAIEIADVNKDSKKDIILGGNLYPVKPEEGRYDALSGLVLLGDGKGDFQPLPSTQSGLVLAGEIRHVRTLKSKGANLISFIRNNDSVKFFKIK